MHYLITDGLAPFHRDNQTFVQGNILEVDRAIEGCEVVYHMAAMLVWTRRRRSR